MRVECPCPPVRNDIVTPRHLFSKRNPSANLPNQRLSVSDSWHASYSNNIHTSNSKITNQHSYEWFIIQIIISLMISSDRECDWNWIRFKKGRETFFLIFNNATTMLRIHQNNSCIKKQTIYTLHQWSRTNEWTRVWVTWTSMR